MNSTLKSKRLAIKANFLNSTGRIIFNLSSRHLLVFGFEEKLEQGSSAYSYFSSWGDYQSDFPRKKASLASFYLQDQWRPWSRLSLTSGVRLDHHQSFGPAATFRLAANLDWPEQQARFKLTLGSGF